MVTGAASFADAESVTTTAKVVLPAWVVAPLNAPPALTVNPTGKPVADQL